MNQELIEKLQYSYAEQNETHPLPLPLKDSLQIISEFFKHNTTNKLCLVFPSKEYAAQWLSIPTVFFLIEKDFAHFKDEIFESYKQYKKGDKLILNNLAIVEWSGIKGNGVVFKTKGIQESSGAEITIRFSDVIMLQKAPASRKVLSSQKTVKAALPSRTITPTEKLLNIDAFGNKEFIKNSICLVSKFKNYDDSISDILMNNNEVSDYFKQIRIDENGNVSETSPLLISNNFLNLISYLTQSKPVSTIIIDGFSSINERRGDFVEIDREFNIPTILITDLSEIDTFDEIGSFGFEFFNFTKESITVKESSNHSPFQTFDRKLNKYLSFSLEREICHNQELESISQRLHSLTKDDSDNNLTLLKISLIQLTNLFSRICHKPNDTEILNYFQKIDTIESNFKKYSLWLGEANDPIGEIVSTLKTFVKLLAESRTEKCNRLNELLVQDYNYVICPTEEEANILRKHIHKTATVITVADITDNLLLGRNVKAILTGWPKSNNFNRILSSFIFSQLTVLFYQFENRYYASLQNRNRKNSEHIKATVDKNGVRSSKIESIPFGFGELFSSDTKSEVVSENSFDIVEFELKLDNIQYSKYSGKGSLAESCKAKRIDFENYTFIYAIESHKFIVINELIDKVKKTPNIHIKKTEALQAGDVIAVINTDRDVLVDLVEKNTKPQELENVKKWTDLWKTLLRDYYASIGSNFKKLIADLRKVDCIKHEATIRTWLQDENRIGPDDDSDLISIALLSNSELLNENINTVRKAISQMTSWRMKASDSVRDKIKNKLLQIADNSIVNSSIEIQDLGTVAFLKISELKMETEEIDKRYIHRLIQKEIF